MVGTQSTVVISSLDVQTGRERWSTRFSGTSEFFAGGLSLNARELALVYSPVSEPAVRIHRRNGGAFVREQPTGEGQLFVRDGKFLFLERETLRVLDLETGLWSMPLRSGPPDGMTWGTRYIVSPDGRRVAETDKAGAITVWRFDDRQRRELGRLGNQALHEKRFSDDGGVLVAYDQSELAAWDLRDARDLKRLRSDAIAHFQFVDVAGEQLDVIFRDGAVQRGSLRDGTLAALSRLESWPSNHHLARVFDVAPGKEVGAQFEGRIASSTMTTFTCMRRRRSVEPVVLVILNQVHREFGEGSSTLLYEARGHSRHDGFNPK